MSSPKTAKPMVEVKGARKAYGELEVLKGIDLSVARGQIVAIIGPSGSGKSTLLRSINHLETLNGGEVWLDGMQVNQPLTGQAFEKHINAVRQKMGMVFQHFNLFPHLTVLENITLGPIKLKGMTKDAARTLALELLKRSGLPTRSTSTLAAVRRSEAACGHCPCARHAAESDAVRRSDFGTRSRAGGRGQCRHEAARR